MEEFSFSQSEIIKRCSAAAFPEEHLGGERYGNRVLRLSAKVAVKYGVGVTQDEAANQEKAFELLDPRIVRVPKVYTFFEDDSHRGYLVMEFMEGVQKDSISKDSEIHELSAILDHFASIKSSKPGALAGGASRALIFGESDPPNFGTVEELEQWFHTKLLEPTLKVNLAEFELIVCHLDFFPRNVLWAEGKRPCVLDWASAGCYPRLFEKCSHLIKQQSESWQFVLNLPISATEESQCDLVMKAWRNMQKYCL